MAGNSIDQYGVMLLTRCNCKFYELVFTESLMQRSVLFGEVVGSKLCVSVTHLESLDNPKVRAL